MSKSELHFNPDYPTNQGETMEKVDLAAMRHSTEHVLHQALNRIYGADRIKAAMGPATEEGFYHDSDHVDPSLKIAPEDFPAIEAEMKKIVEANMPIRREEVTFDQGRAMFKDNPYKLEWLDIFEQRGDKTITVYWTGEEFVDLCRGPHVEATGQIGPFKLLSVAGAYWHGDEKNKMLSRIYGTAFHTKQELEDYLFRQEEAKRRDHRKLGQDLDLFVFADLIGKGLPMLTPKGTVIRRELEKLVLEKENAWGYQHVITPPIAKTELYKTSGHYPYYKDTMYPVMQVDDDELILRPMTCPHHFMLYKSKPRSYRELPLRIAELSPQFRYEKSGELTGLMRVRMFCLADAHIICQKEQAKEEVKRVLTLIDEINAVFGLKRGEDYRYRLSLGDRSNTEKYYKDDAAWDHAENVLREVLIEEKAPYFEAAGEAAFYGPKIDIQMKKISGQEETAFTVQYDFVMPKRFEMRFVAPDGSEQEPVVVHRSSIGAFERTMAFLIEYYAGAFPVWLAPVQAMIVPISDRHLEYANTVKAQLVAAGIRTEIDASGERMNQKIRAAQLQKIPYMLVVGDKEIEANAVALRLRTEENKGAVPVADFVAKVAELVKTRSLEIWG